MNSHPLSKTAALRAARLAVGGIIRRHSTDYVFFAPYRDSDPNGPSTAIEADSYPKATARRAAKVASIALALMGHPGVLLNPGPGWGEDGTTAEELVSAGLKRAQEGAEA